MPKPKMFIPQEIKDMLIKVRKAWESKSLLVSNDMGKEAALQYNEFAGTHDLANNPQEYVRNASLILDYLLYQAPIFLEEFIGNYEEDNLDHLRKLVFAADKELEYIHRPGRYLDLANRVPKLPELDDAQTHQLYEKMQLLEHLLEKLDKFPKDNPRIIGGGAAIVFSLFIRGQANTKNWLLKPFIKIITKVGIGKKRLPTLTQRLDDYAKKHGLVRMTAKEFEEKVLNAVKVPEEKQVSHPQTQTNTSIEEKKARLNEQLTKAHNKIQAFIVKQRYLEGTLEEIEDEEERARARVRVPAVLEKVKKDIIELNKAKITILDELEKLDVSSVFATSSLSSPGPGSEPTPTPVIQVPSPIISTTTPEPISSPIITTTDIDEKKHTQASVEPSMEASVFATSSPTLPEPIPDLIITTPDVDEKEHTQASVDPSTETEAELQRCIDLLRTLNSTDRDSAVIKELERLSQDKQQENLTILIDVATKTIEHISSRKKCNDIKLKHDISYARFVSHLAYLYPQKKALSEAMMAKEEQFHFANYVLTEALKKIPGEAQRPGPASELKQHVNASVYKYPEDRSLMAEVLFRTELLINSAYSGQYDINNDIQDYRKLRMDVNQRSLGKLVGAAMLGVIGLTLLTVCVTAAATGASIGLPVVAWALNHLIPTITVSTLLFVTGVGFFGKNFSSKNKPVVTAMDKVVDSLIAPAPSPVT